MRMVKKYAGGGKADQIKRKLAEAAIEDSISRLPEEIPPDAILSSKGIRSSRKHGDAMDYHTLDVMRSRMAPPFPQNLAKGGPTRVRFARGGGQRFLQRPPDVPMVGGLLNSDVPGRTDKIPLGVGAGSYVIPSRVVSFMGEDNTIAGGAILDKLFKSGPYGTSLPKLNRARPERSGRMIRMPRPSRFADGGNVDVIVAGGEYILTPEQVKEVGHGNLTAGHKTLDAFVKLMIKKQISTHKKLPGPKT